MVHMKGIFVSSQKKKSVSLDRQGVFFLFSLFFFFCSSGGGWVKIKLKLPHSHVMAVANTAVASILKCRLSIVSPRYWPKCLDGPYNVHRGVVLITHERQENTPHPPSILCISYVRQTSTPFSLQPGERKQRRFFVFKSSGGQVKLELQLPHLHVSDYMPCQFNPTLPLQQQLTLLLPGA